MSRSPMHSQPQQQPWHHATKRQILGALNNPIDTVDGSNADHVRSLLEDLQTKYNQILAQLQSELAQTKLQQEEALNVGLMKLPKSVRKLTVQEFNQAHQCDLLALLKSKDGVVLPLRPEASNSTHTTLGKKRDLPPGLETPAPTRAGARGAPMTETRTIRKGEGLFSVNGSPIEMHEVGSVVATVTKKRRGNERGANFEINVGDGRVISLNDPNGVSTLDSSMKATAAMQLKVLQDQMASLMAQLTKD
eukprot:Nitzschia sp. Nitz4//scaffold68_size99682//28591//29420//NITZ4_004557-RA/size99682-processed-gene-0.16-mRNA-1//1//CDS//3329556572//6265//frame0